MRTAKLIITTLLALQLFVTAGLCGGVCCGAEPDQTQLGDLAAKENQEPATEEKIESGHCPLHAARETNPNPQERKPHSSKANKRPAAAHQRSNQTRPSSTIVAHLCACSVKREERLFDAVLQKPSEQRPAVQNLSGAPRPMRWLDEPSPLPITSPASSRSHSPPFNGHRLHLRI